MPVCVCACMHVSSLRSQETLLLVNNLQQCQVSLSFSDSPVLFTSRVCPAPDYIHLTQSSLSLFFSLAGTELFVVLVQRVGLLS